jgi:hypothetical protein
MLKKKDVLRPIPYGVSLVVNGEKAEVVNDHGTHIDVEYRDDLMMAKVEFELHEIIEFSDSQRVSLYSSESDAELVISLLTSHSFVFIRKNKNDKNLCEITFEKNLLPSEMFELARDTLNNKSLSELPRLSLQLGSDANEEWYLDCDEGDALRVWFLSVS